MFGMSVSYIVLLATAVLFRRAVCTLAPRSKTWRCTCIRWVGHTALECPKNGDKHCTGMVRILRATNQFVSYLPRFVAGLCRFVHTSNHPIKGIVRNGSRFPRALPCTNAYQCDVQWFNHAFPNLAPLLQGRTAEDEDVATSNRSKSLQKSVICLVLGCFGNTCAALLAVLIGTLKAGAFEQFFFSLFSTPE